MGSVPIWTREQRVEVSRLEEQRVEVIRLMELNVAAFAKLTAFQPLNEIVRAGAEDPMSSARQADHLAPAEPRRRTEHRAPAVESSLMQFKVTLLANGLFLVVMLVVPPWWLVGGWRWGIWLRCTLTRTFAIQPNR